MGMLPILVPSAKRSEVTFFTNAARISTIDWSRITVASAQRYYPMCGFGSFSSAAPFCCAFDELRNYLRPRQRMGERVPLEQQRRLFHKRLATVHALMMAAS